jgi:putative PIG3 family NAD(P)H quinone oxidoreductase
MKIIDVCKPGGPEALVLAERPVPQAREGEVLIRVAAAGINRADLLQRSGNYPPPAGAPTYPGLEVSGTVQELGAGVSEFKRGDRVCALLQGGGYAEYCVAPAGQVLPLPAGVDLIEGAALAESFFTVWSNVFMFGRLQRGETFLVHGGTSGIGVTAIQLANRLGAEVYATAGSEDKCRFCESLGAKRALNYRAQDFVAQMRSATNGGGANLILDMIAGEYTARNIDTLAEAGRLVIIATQGGANSTINILKIMQKRIVLTGSALRPRPTAFKQEVKRQLLEHAWPRIANGELRVIVDKTFPLHEAAAAHRHMESGTHIGKILLTVAG